MEKGQERRRLAINTRYAARGYKCTAQEREDSVREMRESAKELHTAEAALLNTLCYIPETGHEFHDMSSDDFGYLQTPREMP